jgi:hypothetical protein
MVIVCVVIIIIIIIIIIIMMMHVCIYGSWYCITNDVVYKIYICRSQ